MSNSHLYRTWKAQIEQWLPDACATRQANLVWLIVGMYLSSSVTLSKIARKVPIRAKKSSLTRRFRRFLDNDAVDVWAWYAPRARLLIESAAQAGSVHLIIDSTKVGANRQMMMVAIAYRRRALPLAWDWVAHKKGHSKATQQIALLKRLRQWIPEGVRVSLVGDSEFGSHTLVKELKRWRWDYALRQRPRTHIKLAHLTYYQAFHELPLVQGQALWWRHVRFTYRYQVGAHAAGLWHADQANPVYLITNQTSVQAAQRLYRRRMWIEALFGDLKRNGFCLEHTRLRSPERLSRLVLVIALLYLWIVALGESLIRTNQTHLVDRSDRIDLSIFRLGWDFLERCITFDDPLPICWIPSFDLVSGS